MDVCCKKCSDAGAIAAARAVAMAAGGEISPAPTVTATAAGASATTNATMVDLSAIFFLIENQRTIFVLKKQKKGEGV